MFYSALSILILSTVCVVLAIWIAYLHSQFSFKDTVDNYERMIQDMERQKIDDLRQRHIDDDISRMSERISRLESRDQ